MEAQQTKTITGEYYLSGVMETASGFKLNHDSTFEFFFSYGALDRTGSGTWSKKNDSIIFNSPKPKSQSFALVTNKPVSGDRITIKIIEENSAFLPHIYCTVKSGNKQLHSFSNKDGEISFSKERADSIMLMFEFCQEKVSMFTFPGGTDNYFEFKMAPGILDVLFENFALKYKEERLQGQHPLLQEGIYNFKKTDY